MVRKKARKPEDPLKFLNGVLKDLHKDATSIDAVYVTGVIRLEEGAKEMPFRATSNLKLRDRGSRTHMINLISGLITTFAPRYYMTAEMMLDKIRNRIIEEKQMKEELQDLMGEVR